MASIEVGSCSHLQVSKKLQFPGHYYDEESGLYYNRNRYYNPKTGRYFSSDPIGFRGGLNLYAYSGGNPLTYFDNLGLKVVGTFIKDRISAINVDFDEFRIEKWDIYEEPSEIVWARVDISVYARYGLLIHCKETSGCETLVREGWIYPTIRLPGIPFTICHCQFRWAQAH